MQVRPGKNGLNAPELACSRAILIGILKIGCTQVGLLLIFLQLQVSMRIFLHDQVPVACLGPHYHRKQAEQLKNTGQP